MKGEQPGMDASKVCQACLHHPDERYNLTSCLQLRPCPHTSINL
jgi:hypothetical protein